MNIHIKPATRRFIDAFVAEEIETLTAPDPFLIDDPCPFSHAGHVPQWFHKEIVCVCCAKVFWK